MGALFLQTLDERMEQLGLFYFRYMDDIVVLAPSRWKLRKAVRVVNQTLNGLGLEKRPEKTFIGRIEKGFDFSLPSLRSSRTLGSPVGYAPRTMI
jgi:RNA-directed DNA polymerase